MPFFILPLAERFQSIHGCQSAYTRMYTKTKWGPQNLCNVDVVLLTRQPVCQPEARRDCASGMCAQDAHGIHLFRLGVATWRFSTSTHLCDAVYSDWVQHNKRIVYTLCYSQTGWRHASDGEIGGLINQADRSPMDRLINAMRNAWAKAPRVDVCDPIMANALNPERTNFNNDAAARLWRQ